MRSSLTKQSKFLSLVLRHSPAEFGIDVHPGGWARLEDILAKAPFPLTRESVETIMRESSKARFELSQDGAFIRASHGHSIGVDLQMTPSPPPPRLYHGTAERNLARIRQEGLTRQRRQFVHLHPHHGTARMAGARHGTPCVLEIEAGAMHEKGHLFYESTSNVWLTQHVPARFIRETSE